MCCGWERLNPKPTLISSNTSFDDSRHPSADMNHSTVVTEETFASLLELADNNDVESFKRSIEHDPSGVDEVGLWYSRLKGSKQMVNEERTPFMVASMYGSIKVIRLILSSSDADVNRLRDGKLTLEELLVTENSCFNLNSRVSAMANSDSPPLLRLQENGSLPSGSDSPKLRPSDAPISLATEKKDYPIDPSLPDINNSIYSTDEFRMYSFKVRPCSRAYSHDWTECPFAHPGKNARRRDPWKFHYSCVPCPDFRNGACRRGDMCEYAYGVFECWLHPAQYRTRCARMIQVCCGRRPSDRAKSQLIN
ncbi:Zinc finger CCCH domain-containing protein 30 [Hibiscus syriacus]|uniref:Zinc finger CCCH domain-containing protein 30 n=1 Tax=Hibiscus syriacus TaxID=106335 RepID=A0A6A3CW27_HIBSY|nr:Zinc finger CCCH domain-containing protein 30 [Hibiscus syriacus]